MTDLLSLDLVDASDAVRRGEVDPVALTTAHLHRAEASPLNDWVTLDRPGALRAARVAADQISADAWRGPLHGMPVGVKDLFDTAGLRTTYGSVRFRDHVPEQDAAAVTRLRDAGAVVLGKQATHEFAWGGRTDSPHFGPTLNPHDPARIPGGSSGGGAAALVSGAGLLAVGSDTAGSVRIPAALSGCVGFKPTRDWCPLAGVFPLGPSFDHVGLMARSTADVALAYGALTGGGGPTAADPALAGRIRVGVLGGALDELLEAPVRDAVRLAAERLGEIGVPVETVQLTEVDERVMAILELIGAEAEALHHDAYARWPESYGPDLARRLARGPVPPERRAAAGHVVRRAVDEVDRVLDRVDILLGATVPITAPRIGQLHVMLGGRDHPVEALLTRLTCLANAAGMPAISVPAPVPGLPVGIQLMGRRGDDDLVLATAALLGFSSRAAS